MILALASTLYGAAATWRRSWYAPDRGRQRRLRMPVVSVGNLRVGGTGKTPTVAHLARLLAAEGFRPDVLTRGYGRRAPRSAVTVVSKDSTVEATGDEPLMLARALPDIPVIVCPDRYRAGALGETAFGSTVHLLDDGFQHVTLARAVDLVLVSEDDLRDRVLPAGRLREPLSSARAADAVVVPDISGPGGGVERVRRALMVPLAFGLRRAIAGPDGSGPVLAVAGIERPDRFFGDLRDAGWAVVETMTFPDHHPFSAADVDRIGHAARAAGAARVVTTEKDAVRLERHPLPGVAIEPVPLAVTVEPAEAFRRWLVARIS